MGPEPENTSAEPEFTGEAGTKEGMFPLDNGEWSDPDGDEVGDNSEFVKTISFYQSQGQLFLHSAMVAGLAIIFSIFIRARSVDPEGTSDTSEEE